MNKPSLYVAYPFIFHREDEGGYFIESVDINGAYTGINQDDPALGMLMAQEVLGMTLADMIESGEELPKPTKIDDIDEQNGFVTMIAVNVEDYIRDMSLVKKTLNIPKWANDMGAKMEINFSKVLTDAISELVVGRMG